jgi:acyl carrier protein
VNRDDALDLLARLLHRIAPEVDPGDLVPGAQLQEEFDLDSMDFLNLVTALHDATGIDVPERDYPELASVDGFVSYVVTASDRGGTRSGARRETS